MLIMYCYWNICLLLLTNFSKCKKPWPRHFVKMIDISTRASLLCYGKFHLYICCLSITILGRSWNKLIAWSQNITKQFRVKSSVHFSFYKLYPRIHIWYFVDKNFRYKKYTIFIKYCPLNKFNCLSLYL